MGLPPTPPRPSRRGLAVTVLITVVSVALLLALADRRAVGAAVGQSDWRYLGAASAALLAGMAIYAWRWQGLVGERAGWLITLLAACVGHGLNLLLPLRLGEAARIVVLGRSARMPYSAVASSVVVERMWEQAMRLMALSGAVGLGVGLRPSPATVLGAMAALVGASMGLAWLQRNPAKVLERVPRWLARLPRLEEARVRAALERMLAGLTLALGPRQLTRAAIASVGAWGLFGAFHALVLLALPLAMGPAEVVTLTLGTLALAPPSAPTAPGIYHASLVVPLAVVGYPEADLAAYAVVLHALLMLWLLPMGAIGVLHSRRATREAVPAEH